MSKKILLAEDDEDNRDLIVFMVKRSGLDIQLFQAENGQEAVENLLVRRERTVCIFGHVS